MIKRIIPLLVVFSFFISGNVHASSINQLETDLSNIKKQIEQETDRFKRVELVKTENKTAKILRAYELAKNTSNIQPVNFNNFIFDETSDKPAVIQVGEQWIGNSIYAFGGGRNSNDISKGLFDCSSFVHWAFDQVGIELGNRTSVTTDTLKVLGTQISIENIQP
ncbi:MAG: C40 family peptidase, partial [Euryarchaeota archaeon]|nr:C40 family peptidase [Euryarchaeota archaeon]